MKNISVGLIVLSDTMQE